MSIIQVVDISDC